MFWRMSFYSTHLWSLPFFLSFLVHRALGFPSRMTFGILIELLVGKAGVFEGRSSGRVESKSIHAIEASVPTRYNWNRGRIGPSKRWKIRGLYTTITRTDAFTYPTSCPNDSSRSCRGTHHIRPANEGTLRVWCDCRGCQGTRQGGTRDTPPVASR